MIELEETCRGFKIGNFKDHYGAECSLQHSSLATEDAIWLGVNDINAQSFVAHKGWQKHTEKELLVAIRPEAEGKSDIEAHLVCTTRMHLTKEMVRELIPYLQRFVETGCLHE